MKTLTELICITAHCPSSLGRIPPTFLGSPGGSFEVGCEGWGKWIIWMVGSWYLEAALKSEYCATEWLYNFLLKLYFTCSGVKQFQLKQRWVMLIPILPHVVFRGHQGALISGIISDKQDFPASQASEHIRNTPVRLRSKWEALNGVI